MFNFNNLRLRDRILYGYSVPILLSIGVAGIVTEGVEGVAGRNVVVPEAVSALHRLERSVRCQALLGLTLGVHGFTVYAYRTVIETEYLLVTQGRNMPALSWGDQGVNRGVIVGVIATEGARQAGLLVHDIAAAGAAWQKR